MLKICRIRAIILIILLSGKFYNLWSQPGTEMIYIPGGKFVMGNNDKPDQQPVHEVYLDPYYIDKYEVTNAQFVTYLREALAAGEIIASPEKVVSIEGKDLIIFNTEPSPDPTVIRWPCYISYTDGEFYIEEGMEDHPAVYALWYGADAYCRHYGKRLPTEAEWEKAARGADQRQYPWGNSEPTCSRCNYNDCIGHTTPVGTYSPAGDSPYGCCDMSGNAWEWVNDWYDQYYYSYTTYRNPQGPAEGIWGDLGYSKTLRGGCYGDSQWSKAVRCAFRDGRGWMHWSSPLIAFRGAKDVEGYNTVTDDFNRYSIGPDWTYKSGEWQIVNGEINLTSSCTLGWRYLAIFNKVSNGEGRNVIELSFRWGKTVLAEHTREAAVAIMLDENSPNASGYWLMHRYNEVWLWTIVDGAYVGAIDLGSWDGLNDPGANSYITIKIRQEPDANYFDYYINGNHSATAVDPSKLFPKSNEWYTGLFRHGRALAPTEGPLNYAVNEYSVRYTTLSPDTQPPVIYDISAIMNTPISSVYDQTLQAEDMPIKYDLTYQTPGLILRAENSYIGQKVSFPETGVYQFTLRASGDYVEDEWSKAAIYLDGVYKATITVSSTTLANFSTSFSVTAGIHEVKISFINYIYLGWNLSRHLVIDWLQIYAPDIVTASATISWETDELSDSRVEFGLSSSYGGSTLIDNNLVNSHSVTLYGLNVDTEYHIRIFSRDLIRNIGVSDDYVFGTYQFLSIAGNVKYYYDSAVIPDIQFDLTGDETMSSYSNQFGTYVFNDISAGSNVTVTPDKLDGEDVGTNTMTAHDAALTACFALDLDTLIGDQQFVADVNQDGNVEMIDAAFIARYAVGIDNGQNASVGSWIFTPSQRIYTLLHMNYSNEDYKASLLGDVSGNWSEEHLLKNNMMLGSSKQLAKVNSGGNIVLPIYVDEEMSILSSDIWLKFDNEKINLISVSKTDFSESCHLVYHQPEEGSVRIALYGTNPVVSPGTLCDLQFGIVDSSFQETEVVWEKFRINEYPIERDPIFVVTDVSQTVADATLKYQLNENFPNPFNPATEIRYSLKKSGRVTLKIYNIQGRQIRALVNSFQEKGNHVVVWDGKDDNRTDVPSGVYFCRLISDRYTHTIRMVKTK